MKKILFSILLVAVSIVFVTAQSYDIVNQGGGKYSLAPTGVGASVGADEVGVYTAEQAQQILIDLVKGYYDEIANLTKRLEEARLAIDDLSTGMQTSFGINVKDTLHANARKPQVSNQWSGGYKGTTFSNGVLTLTGATGTFRVGSLVGDIEVITSDLLILSDFFDDEVIFLASAENDVNYVYKGTFAGDEFYISLAK